jgi:hypothetical protein
LTAGTRADYAIARCAKTPGTDGEPNVRISRRQAIAIASRDWNHPGVAGDDSTANDLLIACGGNYDDAAKHGVVQRRF